MPTRTTQRIVIEPASNGFIVAHAYRTSPDSPDGDPVGYDEDKLVFKTRADLLDWVTNTTKEV